MKHYFRLVKVKNPIPPIRRPKRQPTRLPTHASADTDLYNFTFDVNNFFLVGCQQVGYCPAHHTSKLTEATFLDAVECKGKRFQNQSTLDKKTHFKPTTWNLSVHQFFLQPPTRCKNRNGEGHGLKTSTH